MLNTVLRLLIAAAQLMAVVLETYNLTPLSSRSKFVTKGRKTGQTILPLNSIQPVTAPLAAGCTSLMYFDSVPEL